MQDLHVVSWWQNRGQSKPKALPTSAFGRPLLKPAKPAEESEALVGDRPGGNA